jgi:outer membrane receptor protein involved in Fe transport
VGYAANELAIRDAESVTVANFRAGWEFGKWKPALFVENLFDSDDTVGQYLTAADRTNVTSRGLRPRTIGLAADFRF